MGDPRIMPKGSMDNPFGATSKLPANFHYLPGTPIAGNLPGPHCTTTTTRDKAQYDMLLDQTRARVMQ